MLSRTFVACAAATVAAATMSAGEDNERKHIAVLVKGIRQCLEKAWASDAHPAPSLRDYARLVQQLAALPPDALRSASAARELSVEDKKLLEIALDRRARSEVYAAVKAAASEAARQAAGQRSPQPKVDEDLRKEGYRLVWEEVLLNPFSGSEGERHLLGTVILACWTLRKIKDPGSIETLEIAYRWAIRRRTREAKLIRHPIYDALVAMGRITGKHLQVFSAAWRCYAATPDPTEQRHRYRQARGGLDKNLVRQELTRLARSHGYVEFLRSLLGRTGAPRSASPEDTAVSDALLGLAISQAYAPRGPSPAAHALALTRASKLLPKILGHCQSLGSRIVEVALIFPGSNVRTACASLLKQPISVSDGFKERLKKELLGRRALAKGAEARPFSFEVGDHRFTVAPCAHVPTKAVVPPCILVIRSKP